MGEDVVISTDTLVQYVIYLLLVASISVPSMATPQVV